VGLINHDDTVNGKSLICIYRAESDLFSNVFKWANRGETYLYRDSKGSSIISRISTPSVKYLTRVTPCGAGIEGGDLERRDHEWEKRPWFMQLRESSQSLAAVKDPSQIGVALDYYAA
jgi:hypothetical protein